MSARSPSPRTPSSGRRSLSPSPVRRRATSATRTATLRTSRRSTGSGRAVGRVSIESSAATTRPRVSASRIRRPTPIVRRGNRQYGEEVEDDDDDLHETSTDEGSAAAGEQRQQRGNESRQVRATLETNQRNSGGRNERRRVTRFAATSGHDLTWYERLMPECVLNMTAPITGYETNLESDVEDEEYEILERQRIKRNRRVRRRLLTIMLLATAASFFFYSKGRFFRSSRSGVKAALSSMTKKVEDGISKSIQGIENLGK